MLPLPEAASLRGARVLVTGASGFLAAGLMRTLLAAGADVHGTVRPGSPSWRLRALPAVTLHEADLEEFPALERAFAMRPEYLFHLATPRAAGRDARARLLRGNVLGADHLMRLSLAHDVRRLVVTGSAMEYRPVSGPMGEGLPLEPTTWHGATKAAASLLFQQAARADGLPVVLLRLHHVYGPWESAHRLLPTAIRAALEGKPLALTGPGPRRDFVFSGDVVEALVRAALSPLPPGEVFNIGSGVEHGNEALVACVERVIGRPIIRAPQLYPARVTDAPSRVADPRKAADRLGWRAAHTLEAGVRDTVAWYRRHPGVWSDADDPAPRAI